ncbi:hypothetical protein C3L33_17954, partial [Rhododendron williamsianum]
MANRRWRVPVYWVKCISSHIREENRIEFLHGSHRQSLFLPRNLSVWRNRVLWGTLRSRIHSPRISAKHISFRPSCRLKVRAAVSGDVSSVVDDKSREPQMPTEKVLHFFRIPLIQEGAKAELLKSVQTKVSNRIVGLKTEQCFNVGLDSGLSSEKLSVLKWLLGETYEPDNLGTESFLDKEKKSGSNMVVIEVGPRLSFTTAWSANAVSICRACGLTEVTRIERSRRYLLYIEAGNDSLQDQQVNEFTAMCVPEEVRTVPVVERGREALEEINQKMGLAFDEHDLEYYTKLFRDDIKRNPTTVELFDIAQSNSEHSRHWFFTGKIVVDGQPMTVATSSAWVTCPLNTSTRDLDILFTAETHNFPCAVAPYPGAETGAGGRIRDTHATGRGSFVVASTAGYCVGNLNMEDSYAPWEDPSFSYPSNLASPLQILIDASNGASDYGNKFGEPLIQGYTRFFGMRLPNGERREWLKPIMFSGGIGMIDDIHISKGEPDIGMLVVKIGGPAYRIGMGGGAASSMVSGQNDAELDFNAVQRGDAEMAQKLYRVVRACVEMGDKNPIVSIHDQGAGGNCNVVKEIIYPEGAEIDIRAVVVGDHTMSVLEIWGAEYQEQDAILVNPESRSLLQSICDRERVSMAVIGTISGEGRVVLVDSKAIERCRSNGLPPPPPAVDLELEKVLGTCLRKLFSLVAQQQTVGPLQLPLSDVAVIAQTYNDFTGGACAIGEQPIKGLLDPKAMARLAVGEAVTNLVWAKVTSLSDVKASGNWMYAAKLDGEGADMYDAAIALSETMIELGIAIDGGKDSLSMAAHASGEVVKAPGNLVISAYVTCTDITKTVTPDLKLGDDGVLLLIDLAKGKRRLGGSALAHAFGQVGDDCPDLDDVSYLKRVFDGVQDLLSNELISAGHDVSDEELGLVLEISKKNLDTVMGKLGTAGISADIIGQVTAEPLVELKFNGVDEKYMTVTSKPKVAVIREEGSNGDREMSAAFFTAGFEPWDITMSDLLNGVISLQEFRGAVFVGGFSYADVLDSAKGWSASIRFNKPLLKQFEEFYKRPDTFSLGVCNGCQLMALLGWVPGPEVGGVFGVGGDPSQPRFVHNESGRFECRFTSVTIKDSPALMFKGMEGSTLGVWAAHGEGRAYFPDGGVLDRVLASNLAPLRYCDDDGKPTEVYPFNLNGSPLGIAAICSPDGRHLALMPHPERCFLMWQFLGTQSTGISIATSESELVAVSGRRLLASVAVEFGLEADGCRFQGFRGVPAVMAEEAFGFSGGGSKGSREQRQQGGGDSKGS